MVLALHRLGKVAGFSPDWSDLGGWLATVSPEDAIAATLRLVALALAWWLLVTTVLYAPGPHRWTGRVGASRRVGDASRGAPPGGSGRGSELGGDDDRRPGGGGDRPHPRSGTSSTAPDRRRSHPGPAVPATADT